MGLASCCFVSFKPTCLPSTVAKSAIVNPVSGIVKSFALTKISLNAPFTVSSCIDDISFAKLSFLLAISANFCFTVLKKSSVGLVATPPHFQHQKRNHLQLH
ncbi:hypothetical protein BB381_08200 [Campylobacter pinnipediorum subsp. caledonicus]|nr:hypothetical protein BB381_08200 [Campylobacter pinnipediorum subsp. caledonicus]